MNKQNRSDRIFPETRWVAGLAISFLVAAFAIMYFLPHNTATLFA